MCLAHAPSKTMKYILSSVGNETLKNVKLFHVEFEMNAFDSQYQNTLHIKIYKIKLHPNFYFISTIFLFVK